MEDTSIIKKNAFVQISQLIYYTFLWFIFYLIVHNFINFKAKKMIVLDVKNRLVSISHGFMTFSFCCYFVYLFGFNIDMEDNVFADKINCFAQGYFIYDLIACIYFGLYDKKLILHHMTCIIGGIYLLLDGRGAFVVVFGLLMAESSNFPMHFRVICRSLGLKNTKLYELADIMYMVIYFIFRGLMAPVVCIMTYMSSKTPLMIKIAYSSLLFQSLYFISIMYSICKKKRKEYNERQSKKIKLFWLSENPEVKNLKYFQKKQKLKIF